MLLLLDHPGADRFQSLPRRADFLRGRLATSLLETVQHMDYVAHSRQVDDAIPRPLILVPQLKNSRADGTHRPVVRRLCPCCNSRRSNPKLYFTASGNELSTSLESPSQAMTASLLALESTYHQTSIAFVRREIYT